MSTETGGVKDSIDKIIRSHKVAVFSKPGCPYCLGARNTIRKHIDKAVKEKDVIFVDIEEQTDARAYANYLKLITGAPVVPNIFIHGEFIGGFNHLKSLYKTGELATKLKNKQT